MASRSADAVGGDPADVTVESTLRHEVGPYGATFSSSRAIIRR